MNNMKSLSVALLALGLSAPTFATGAVLIPSQHGGVKVGIDALYLQASNSDLNYATNLFFPSNFAAGSQQNAYVDPGYDWGFYVQAGYLFPCTGNDLTLGYTHLRVDETDSIIAGPSANGRLGNPAIIILPFAGDGLYTTNTNFPELMTTAQGKATFDLNAFDLEGGQRFTTGAYDIRMLAGLRYTNLDHVLQTTGQVSFAPAFQITEDIAAYQTFKSQFRGIGPRAGVEGRYCLGSGFGLDGNLNTALLIGQVDSQYYAKNKLIDDDGIVSEEGGSFESRASSQRRLVPVLDAKLGVDYTYIVDCRCKSSLVLEAGYQTTNYFNVVDHTTVVNPQTSIPDGPAPGTTTLYQNTTSDVGFSGVYFGVKYYA